jgi:hypothetical protein
MKDREIEAWANRIERHPYKTDSPNFGLFTRKDLVPRPLKARLLILTITPKGKAVQNSQTLH